MSEGIIYEVEMTMSHALYARERLWLRQHIDAMVHQAGFVRATLHAVELLDEPSASPVQRVCVQYTVVSRQHLLQYFEHGAQAMRADGLAHLGDGCVFRRRILEPEN